MMASDRTAVTDPAAEPDGRARRLAAVGGPWLPAAAAVLLGLSAGWAAVSLSGVLHLQLSPLHVAFLAGAVLAALAILRRPVLGLVVLVLAVYLHLSDVLIRHHDLPSLLQLLAIPLMAAVIIEWREDVLEGLSPWALTAALAAYVLVFLLSSTVAENPALAEARTVEAGKDFVLYALVLLLATTPGRVRAGAWAVTGGGLLLGGIALIQVATAAYGNDFGGLARVEHAQIYGDVMETRISGPLGDPNFFAQILVIVVPVALFLAWKERNRWLRLLALGAGVVAAAATFFTYSRGGAVALGAVLVGSLLAARLGWQRLLAGGAALLLVGVLFLPGDFTRRLGTLRQLAPGQERVEELDTSLRNRILQAGVAWRLFLDHPVLGAGAGNYTEHYYEYADKVGSSAPEYDKVGGDHYAHNFYLELASETGFLGLVTFGAVLLLVFGHLTRAGAAYRAAGDELHAALASALAVALLGYLVSSLFLHDHFQRYLWVLFGLAAALAREAPTASLAGAEDRTSPAAPAGADPSGRNGETGERAASTGAGGRYRRRRGP